jgi:CRISPR-associated protein Cas4
MDSAIPISAINDFLYCPRSLYLHSIYSTFQTNTFHDTPQVLGGIAHENIEKGKYTTSAHILQGLSVYSLRLGIKGKIDLYDSQKNWLIERKYRVKQIYLGFKYQLYAQIYCLEEAEMPVKQLFIQSLSDNRRYEIPLPSSDEEKDFEKTIEKMKSFTPLELQNHACSHCQNNIYSLLNW